MTKLQPSVVPEWERLRRARGVDRRWPTRLPRSLLIVESPEWAPDHLADDLDLAGIAAELVRRGSEGLIAIGRMSPAAVIMGLDLVDVALDDWMSAVQSHDPAMPIYVSLGDGSAEAARAAITAGATGILDGGCSADVIARRLADMLRPLPLDRLSPAKMRVGPLDIDILAFEVRVHGSAVNVPPKEFELLSCLMSNATRVVSFDEIGEWLWGADPDRPPKRTINSHVQKLRRHLGDHTLIRTVRGQGYTVSHLNSHRSPARRR